jgi:hypothetical protein
MRGSQRLAEECLVHVYKALTALIRLRALIISEASLDEIQAMLEAADGEISQARQPKKCG